MPMILISRRAYGTIAESASIWFSVSGADGFEEPSRRYRRYFNRGATIAKAIAGLLRILPGTANIAS